jgi:hypothetical protein
MQAQHQASIEQAQQQHQADIEAQATQHQSVLLQTHEQHAAVVAEKCEEHIESMASTAADHSAALDQAQQQHQADTQAQAAQHAAAVDQIHEQHDWAVQGLHDAKEIAIEEAEAAHAGSLAMVVMQSKEQSEQQHDEQQAELALVLNERIRALDRVESEHAMVAVQLRGEHEATVERLLEALEAKRQGEEQGELMEGEIRSLRAERKELIKKWSDDISMLHKLLEQEIGKRNKGKENDRLYQAKERLLSSRFKAFSASLGREARRQLQLDRGEGGTELAVKGPQIVTKSQGNSDLPKRLGSKAGRPQVRRGGQRQTGMGAAAAAAGMVDEEDEDPGEMCQTQ